MSSKKEKHKGLEVLTMVTYQDWFVWLGKHYSQSEGVWLKFVKKGTANRAVVSATEKSLTYEEAREGAIIFGWIDGLINSYTESTYLRKFTHRRPRSSWSKINREIAEQLIKTKKIKPSGLAEVKAAKSDGRWDAAYDSPSTAKVPADLAKLLSKNKKAKMFFDSLGSANRYAFLYRIQSVKRQATRERHLKKTIEMLVAGEVYHPELRKKNLKNKKICLLRGINVGGKNKLKMADLKTALASPKIPNAKRLIDLQTYIQSGNLVFQSTAKDSDLEKIIAQQIKKSFGYEVSVFVRPASFFEKALKANPFKKRDAKLLCCTFLSKAASKTKIASLSKVESGNDEFKVKKDVIFLYLPDGVSKTKLHNNFLEKHFETSATSRNWRTVSKLVAMAKED